MLLLAALSAIAVPLILVALFRLPARIGMPISAVCVALVALFIWKMPESALVASTLQGAHRALTILWILVGALLLLNVLRRTGALERIKRDFHALSPDMRVQAVLVAFAFVCLVEGVSGFGTPAAIAVPILLALGFRPLAAVVLALAGNAVATSFGAVGTPLLVGLENVPDINDQMIREVGQLITSGDLLVGLLLPTGLASVLIIFFGRKERRLRDILEILPWTLTVGAVYSGSALALPWLIGPEFVSIISASLALIIGALLAGRGWLLPAQVWRHHTNEEAIDLLPDNKRMNSFKAWLPYILVIAILLVQRAVPSIKTWSQSVLDLSWHSILGFEQISSAWTVLLSPGTVLIIVALVALWIGRTNPRQLKETFGSVGKGILISALALVPTLMMVQIFINSGINDDGLLSMPAYIGHELASLFGSYWLAAAPPLGTITAFITGSSTVSTLTMAPVQFEIASQAGLPENLVLAAHISGSNAGNMIAIHNVVAASVVAGLAHREGSIIRRILPITGVYLLLVIAGSLTVYAIVR